MLFRRQVAGVLEIITHIELHERRVHSAASFMAKKSV